MSLGTGHFNEERNVRVTPSQYIHARLKSTDDRFASNVRYLFAKLDMNERAAMLGSTTFAENKRFRDNVTTGQVNSSCTRRMLLEKLIYNSFKNFPGTPQYKHNPLLDVLAKVTQFGCYTFFLTLTAGIPKFWPGIIQMLG